MENLTVTLIQADLAWENISANLAHFTEQIRHCPPSTDVIVLPEMFTTGFSRHPEPLAETMTGATVQWMQDMANNTKAHVVGSAIIGEGKAFYNRLLWATPDGKLYTYDKRHLFRLAGEHKAYTAGHERLTVEVKGWNLRPFICYDLRFPVWSRNVDLQYDVAIYIANWPTTRLKHWQALLPARAIENQCYVVGVNRVGRDGLDTLHSGGSTVISPKGDTLFQADDTPCLHTETLLYEPMARYRSRFPFWQDADKPNP